MPHSVSHGVNNAALETSSASRENASDATTRYPARPVGSLRSRQLAAALEAGPRLGPLHSSLTEQPSPMSDEIQQCADRAAADLLALAKLLAHADEHALAIRLQGFAGFVQAIGQDSPKLT
jgi:hypothetical protein